VSTRPARTRELRAGAWTHVVPAILLVVAVFVLGLMPGDPAPDLSFHYRDKVGHFVVFGLVQFSHLRAGLFLFPQQVSSRVLWGAVGTSSFVGLALEVVQSMVPHRSAEFADLLADVLGALFAALLVRRFRPSLLLESK